MVYLYLLHYSRESKLQILKCKIKDMDTENYMSSRLLLADAFFLGFTLLGAQIILLREFLMVYSGNELVIGLLLSIWLLLTALGSWSGRFLKAGKNYDNIIRILFIFISIYPLAGTFAIEFFRNQVLEPGRMASLTEVMGYSSLLLLPLCFTGGFLFTLISVSSGSAKGNMQQCYAFESFGSLAGGGLISLFFVYYLNIDNFRSLEYLMILDLIFFGIHDFRQGKLFESFVFIVITLGMMLLIYKHDPNKIAKNKLFAGQKVLLSKETAYGNLTITRTQGQLNFFENGVLLFSTGNIEQREEDVHYAMFQRPDAQKVLLIGGGMTGTTLELLKYPDIKQLDYLEVNPTLFKLTREYTPYLMDKRIRTFAVDPLIYIKRTAERYDVIFINQPPPSNAELNRFFTLEFYQRLKKLLLPGGLLSTRLPSSENYLSNDEVELQSSIFNSLKKDFANVEAVPGKKLYFLASDSTLVMNFAERYQSLNLDNKYVNDAYLNDALIQFRSQQIMDGYKDKKILNRDFRPVVYLMYIRHWLSFYGNTIWIIPTVCIVLLLLFLVLLKPYPSAMFTSGFTGASAEIALLIAFQVIFGYVYLFLGVIITIFMGGLTIGSLMSKNYNVQKATKLIVKVQFISGLFILVPAIYIKMAHLFQNDDLTRLLFSIAMLTIAVLVGFQYGIAVSAARKKPAKTVSSIYSSDLIGSSLGSILVAIYFIPVYGLFITLVVLSALHFLTIYILTVKGKLKYL